LSREPFFVGSARDGHGSETHLAGVLNTEVAETSDSLHGDSVAAAGPAVAKGVERRDPCAEERTGFDRVQSLRNAGHRLDRDDRVLREASVLGDARDLGARTVDELPSPARRTFEALSTVPAHAYAIAFLEVLDPRTQGVDSTRDLVARHSRQL